MNFDVKKERVLFDNVASDYDKYRLSYPKEIIKEIKKYINENAEVLEIGCATGNATKLFFPIKENVKFLCIDPGKNLIEIGQKNFKHIKNVFFAEGLFEDFDFQEMKFDLIFSAQAWHWIKQPIGYQKVYHLLKNFGTLALMWNMYIITDSKDNKELLELSNKYHGFEDFVRIDQLDERFNKRLEDINKSGLLKVVSTKKVKWSKEYSLDDYYGFLKTSNSIIKMNDESKHQLYLDLKNYFNKQESQKIIRNYVCALYICKKVDN